MAKVLIADDVSLDQQIVSDIVKKIGHQVILASEGENNNGHLQESGRRQILRPPTRGR